MRPFRLARIAAEAESVRLKGLAARLVTRILCAVVALVFMLGALAFAHLAAWYGLRMSLNQTYLASTGILGGADLLIAVIFGLLASRSAPSRVEVEAIEIRRRALQSIGSSLNLAQLIIPIVRLALDLRRRNRA